MVCHSLARSRRFIDFFFSVWILICVDNCGFLAFENLKFEDLNKSWSSERTVSAWDSEKVYWHPWIPQLKFVPVKTVVAVHFHQLYP